MKKAIKISAIVLGFIILAVVALPFVFKGKIEKAVQSEINKNLNAVVTFDGVGVSLIRHFPDLTVKVNDLVVKGSGEFEKDTLASIPALSLTLDLASVFRGSNYKVKQIGLTAPRLLFKVLKNGKANWDIMKETAADTVSAPSAFKVYLEKVKISDARIVYDDAEMPAWLAFDGLTGTMSGDMTADITSLDINAVCKEITYDYDGVRYMGKTSAELKTLLNANLATWTFTFTDGNLKLNDLNIKADGFFAMPEEGYRMDIKFAARENTFKSFLSLIPAIYSKDFENVKTSGTMALDGFVKGLYSDDSIPSFSVNLKVADGRFSYPGLPGSVSDINLQAAIANPDGVLDHTTVDVPRMHLNMMQSPVDITLAVRTPVSDPDIKATVKGKANLANVSKVYPLGDQTSLTGMVDADMAFSGKISAIEKGAYDQFKASGFATVDKLVYAGAGVSQPVNISKARLDFTPAFAQLTGLALTIGKNDLSANGRLENYIPYVMKKNAVLKGSLTTTSTYMDINSLVAGTATPAAKKDTTALTVVEIPGNMDLALNTSFGQLLYDTYDIRDVAGVIKVKDHTLLLEGLQLNVLGGAVTMKGSYSTFNPEKPLVDMDLQVKNLDVKKAFTVSESFQRFAPIGEKLNGIISTNLKFKGALKKNMMPELTSVSAYGLLLSDMLGLANVNTLGKIADVLKIDKLRNPSLEKINLSFDIVNGNATVKPMDFKLGSYKANISGTTGLDQVLNFVLALDIPRTDFGAKANNVLQGLVSDASKKGVNVNLGDIIPITILIGGTATDPKITTGIKSAMAGLAEDMKKQAIKEIEKKKEEVIAKAKEEVSNLILQADAEASRIIAEAEKQSQKLMQVANKAADDVRFAADSSASRLMAEGKKNGYIAEMAAKKGAEKIKKEGDAQATKVIAEAQKQSDALLNKARAEAEKIKQDALNRVNKQ